MKVVIWGAGNVGAHVGKSFTNNAQLAAYIDINKNLIGSELNAVKIRSYTDLKTIEHDMLIIANTHAQEIKKILTEIEYKKPVIDVLASGILDPRINFLRICAETLIANKVAGSVAEAGVYRGDFTQLIDTAFKNTHIYLFDTFEGFIKTDVALELSLSNPEQGMFTDTNTDLVKAKLSGANTYTFVKGNFPHSCSQITDQNYCFVSIDFDLYRPTYDAVKYFYTRLSCGGYILVHDYHNNEFKGVKKAVDELKHSLQFVFLPINDGGGSVVIGKPWK